jgi:hypothetical protein
VRTITKGTFKKCGLTHSLQQTRPAVLVPATHSSTARTGLLSGSLAAMENVVDREQMDEFYSVRESAYDALRLGTPIEHRRSVPMCQFLILPSFENPVSWDVIRVVSREYGAQTRLYRSCWRMDLDSKAMSSPVERLKHPRPYNPTLETDWVLVDKGKLEAILARFNVIRIPLTLATARAGCDGTSFELAVGDFFCSARIGWWCDLPEEWQELSPVVAELENLFESTWERGRG